MFVNNAGVWTGLFLLVCAVLMFKTSLGYGYYGKYGPGAGLFPMWISGGLIIFSVLYILESLKQKGYSFAEVFPRGRGLSYMLTVVASISILIVIIDYTGYIIAGTIMLLPLFLREYKWHWAIGLSVVTALCLYLVFQVFLKIPLPQGVFWG
jgi:hypothetical protein